ncbi:MAG TPA: exodeoxyribonuclease VII small subunit [Tenuifilaceae bacterium]|jgi:exodeoxyribonuclease VII small subunit|nr:exodeoxyribonuclease VII small subunit [Bacteroidales bacterium]HNT41263.1 exodeoxyribonuclease VII small subunit [Tenuifilaceae bacterium]MBP8643333.1 exodeoxyribonuclease VII small subunit [Bacteroidales bacterium]NLI88146.1 exodeoxyribonuclease VII small subunit [Bacteroidales bacterium]HNY09012.1 exodeoxyribonuclease VII small subunit [Tenuifilaceae bacterium]
MTKKPQRYIDAINEIEQIITEIENNELDVDDLTEKIRRASELLKFCKTKLRATEEEIQKIISDFEEDS